MNLDLDKIDQLLQYILAVAGQGDYMSRELGMIHLIKYMYLADLEYAKYHDGDTFSGLLWKFHHFGPWSVECYKRIDPALSAIGATKKEIETSKTQDDIVRWYTEDDQLFNRLNDQIDLCVAGAVQKYVNQFGNDTYGLLDFIYNTEPMLNAAPGEPLSFKSLAPALGEQGYEPLSDLTARQKKIRRARLADFKKKLNESLEEKIRYRKTSSCPLPPRYDDVFFEGLAILDQADEPLPPEGDYIAIFSDDIWKSKARHDPEIS